MQACGRRRSGTIRGSVDRLVTIRILQPPVNVRRQRNLAQLGDEFIRIGLREEPQESPTLFGPSNDLSS